MERDYVGSQNTGPEIETGQASEWNKKYLLYGDEDTD